jgi:23S rRNA (cytosine1962-C5)-methyltransferase
LRDYSDETDENPRYNHTMKKIIIKAGREKSLLRKHPWIFSGALKLRNGDSSNGAASGDIVRAVAEDGRFLAIAAFSEKSQIVARVLSFDDNEIIDENFFRARVRAAIQRRVSLKMESNAVRLIHAESDQLPGVIVDRYGHVAVMQILTAGMESQRELVAKLLMEEAQVKTVYERSDADVRALEGLDVRNGLVAGAPLAGEVVINENGINIAVDIAEGHKTGFYLDQRDNRALTKSLARDADVLNCFCYTGGMSVAALAGGAKSVLSIDSSGPALETAKRNVTLNKVDAARAEFWEADVFAALRKLRDMGKYFDLIILDPPKFAPTAHHAEKAARAYKDINLLGFKLLRPGGRLMTFSCSGGISAELFQKIIAGAALDANVDAQIIRHLSSGIDHPVALSFPEGDYLKGLLLHRI